MNRAAATLYSAMPFGAVETHQNGRDQRLQSGLRKDADWSTDSTTLTFSLRSVRPFR